MEDMTQRAIMPLHVEGGVMLGYPDGRPIAAPMPDHLLCTKYCTSHDHYRVIRRCACSLAHVIHTPTPPIPPIHPRERERERERERVAC